MLMVPNHVTNIIDSFLTTSEFLQDEDEPGKFHALPYQLTHPVVKLVTQHFMEYLKARAEYNELLEADLMSKKPKTKAAQKKVEELQHAKRFAVLNRRTGWLATSDWLSKHMTVDKSTGLPTLKKQGGKNAKIKPWILTVQFKIKEEYCELLMQPSAGRKFRTVRCMSLLDGALKTSCAQLAAGYAHVLEEGDDDALLQIAICQVGHPR